MANNVFANGLEVSCKVADGKSIASFPDPCWTPPPPPTGPIVLPFPNTAYAKHTKKGSKTVTIGGHEVMLKGKSFFKKSTGNEAATQAFNKGLMTRKLKGKAYFVTSSMNVMVEGKKVVRHTDLTTHNHGSGPGNTITWPYVDSAEAKKACAKDIEKVEEDCNVEDDNKSTWKHQHCKNLMIKPVVGNIKKLENLLNSSSYSVPIKKMYEISLSKLNARISNDDIKNSKQANMADHLSVIAKEDKCLSALRCRLTPFKDSELKGGKKESVYAQTPTEARMNDTNGCCPGQTGHHLIPSTLAKDLCDPYDRANAPVVCVEGTSHSSGSHGVIHKFIYELMGNKFIECGTNQLSIDEVINVAAKSLRNTFEEAECDAECIKKQLEGYYKNCNGMANEDNKLPAGNDNRTIIK